MGDELVLDNVVQITRASLTVQQALAKLANATTVGEVTQIANGLSAAATKSAGAVLYSGAIGAASANSVAIKVAASEGLNIINDTARAQFLSNKAVEQKLTEIYASEYKNSSVLVIKNLVKQKLYGGSLNSLWGQASAEFASTISGKIIVIATKINPIRVFGSVEIPALLNNISITAINNVNISSIARTTSGLVSFVESSFTAALAKGGAFASGSTGITSQLLAKQTLADLGLSTKGAKTAAQLTAEGLVDESPKVLETTAAGYAETFLAAGGSKALGLLARIAGSVFGGVVIDFFVNMKQVDAGGDYSLAQSDIESLALDTPDADENQLATTDSDGTSVVNVPLDSAKGKLNDQYVLAENPTTQTATLADVTNNDSELLLSSDLNGKPVLDEKVIDTLPNNAYDDQISITTDANGIIDVDVKVEKNDTITVDADQTLTGVSQDFTFASSSGTLQIDNPSSLPGTIFAFVPGDVIDLINIGTATRATLVANNVLSVNEADGKVVTLKLSPTENYKGDVFAVASDGNGGTDIGIEFFAITPSDPTVDEDGGSETFTITRSGDISQATTVYVSTTDGTTVSGESTNDGDFNSLSDQPVTFAAGSDSATVDVTINDPGITGGASKNFGLEVSDGTSSSAPVLAHDGFSIIDNDATNYDLTYTYTGTSFTESADDDKVDYTPGNVTASVTFEDVPLNYTGLYHNTLYSAVSAYGDTYSAGPNEGLTYSDFIVNNGEITQWVFGSTGSPHTTDLLSVWSQNISASLMAEWGIAGINPGAIDEAFYNPPNVPVDQEDQEEGLNQSAPGAWALTSEVPYTPAVPDTLVGSTSNVIKLIRGATAYLTAGARKRVEGSKGSVDLANAQASVTGNNDSIHLFGNNTVKQNGASDTFVFQRAIGEDIITGFASTDSMQFSAFDFANWSALLGHISQSGRNTVIALDAPDTVTLTNVTAASLVASQFHFV